MTEQFSREYHVVCNGTTNRPGEKGIFWLGGASNYGKLLFNGFLVQQTVEVNFFPMPLKIN